MSKNNPLVPVAPEAWSAFRYVGQTGRRDLEMRFDAACREIERLRGRLAELSGVDPEEVLPKTPHLPSPKEVILRESTPAWMQEQVDVFYERVELMVLAFILKHGQRPKLFCADHRAEGQMVAFLHPAFVADDGEGVHPKLAELARRMGPGWKERFPAIEPDDCVVYMTAQPGDVRVTVEVRTAELLDDLAKRQSAVAGFLKMAREAMH